MKIVLGVVGAACAVGAGILLTTAASPWLALALLAVALGCLLLTVGGAAGAGS